MAVLIGSLSCGSASYVCPQVNDNSGGFVMDILLDWVSFTLMPGTEDGLKLYSFAQNRLWEFLRLDAEYSNFLELRGVNGYYKRFTYNGVTIQFPKIERVNEIGVNIVLSGNGCRYIESLIGWQADGGFTWAMFFSRLLALSSRFKVNICRIDCAVDDKADTPEGGKLNLDEIRRTAALGNYVSKSRTFNSVVTREGFEKTSYVYDDTGKMIGYRHMKPVGKTLYFGSRGSNTYIRIYDKAAEQGVDGHWVRFEVELKQRNALYVVRHIMSDGDNFGRFFASFVFRYLRFVAMDDSNISRCSVLDWWQAFLGDVEKLKIVLGEFEAKTIEKMINVFTRSWATNLFCLIKTVGADFVLDNIVTSGAGRLSKRHRDAIDNYFYEQGGGVPDGVYTR